MTLYSRPGCHLCEEMKAALERASHDVPARIAIEEIDISSDAKLEERYGLEIPVLVIDGRKVAKYRVSDEKLRRLLTGMVR